MHARPSPALVRDIARLVAKYGLDEFAVLVVALRDSTFLDELASAVAELRSRGVAGRPGQHRPSELESLAGLDPASAVYLQELQTRLIERRALQSRSELLDFARWLGIKEPLPKERKSAVRRLIRTAAALPADRLQSLQEQVERPDRSAAESSYREWARIIMGTRSEKGPSTES